MNMWASAKAFTRGDLRRAFEEYAEAHGQELAASALRRSTGAWEVSAVSDGRILNGMVELVGGYSFVGRATATQSISTITNDFSDLHRRLGVIRDAAFARMHTKLARHEA